MASLIALPPAVAAPHGPADWKDWLAGEATGFSGVVLIGRDDTIDAEMGFDLAGPAPSPMNSAGTRFNLGSINKTFTAIGIAQLIEQGRLGLDDTLVQHLPDYPNQDAAGRITIRQLLTHRSGVAQFMRADFGDTSIAAMTRIVGEEPLAFEPGTRQQYSNGGYIVLGRVIEVVSGKSYSEFLSDHIFRPAGASQPRAGNPAGGGYSTAADLFRFARALRSGRLLGPDMTRYVLDGTFAEDPKWGFALREQIVGGHRFLGNGGGAPGVNAEFRFEPAAAYTIVVLSDSSPPSATNLLTAIVNRIAGIAPAVAPAAAAGQATAAATGRTPSTGLRGEVEMLHAEMMSAFRERPANAARYYTDDARILGGGRRYQGTGEVLAYFSQVPPMAEWTLEIVDVGGSRDAPWVLGRSTLARAGTPGTTVDYLAILRRDADGRLRYYIDMFTASVR